MFVFHFFSVVRGVAFEGFKMFHHCVSLAFYLALFGSVGFRFRDVLVFVSLVGSVFFSKTTMEIHGKDRPRKLLLLPVVFSWLFGCLGYRVFALGTNKSEHP